MTRTQAQILELFQSLPGDEQRELAEHLYEQTRRGSFYDRMTPEQRAQLQDGIDQADRGDVVDADQVLDRLAQRLALKRA